MKIRNQSKRNSARTKAVVSDMPLRGKLKLSTEIGALPSRPDRCFIFIPGTKIAMPAIFKSWIYDGLGNEVDE